MKVPEDSDVLGIAANHPHHGRLRYERVRQDRRWYYRLLRGEHGTGSLTDATHARQTIEYWRTQGWLE